MRWSLLASMVALAGFAATPGCDDGGDADADADADSDADGDGDGDSDADSDADGACDRYTFATTCEGQVLTVCGAGGAAEQVDCGAAGASCEAGAPGCVYDECGPYLSAVCVGDAALARSNYASCDVELCPEGQVCAESTDAGSDGAACVLPALTACAWETYEETCAGDAATTECTLVGYVTETPCQAGDVCVDGHCQRPDGEACEQSSFESRCDGSTMILCSGYGHTMGIPCPSGSTCVVNGGGQAQCVIDPPTTCNATSFEVRCVQDWAAVLCVEGYEAYASCDECVCEGGACDCRLVN